jgi:hypothetical protein
VSRTSYVTTRLLMGNLDYFTLQTWCRAKKKWESETLCLDCHRYSWREYSDPDFKTPEDYEKERWTQLVSGKPVEAAA